MRFEPHSTCRQCDDGDARPHGGAESVAKDELLHESDKDDPAATKQHPHRGVDVHQTSHHQANLRRTWRERVHVCGCRRARQARGPQRDDLTGGGLWDVLGESHHSRLQGQAQQGRQETSACRRLCVAPPRSLRAVQGQSWTDDCDGIPSDRTWAGRTACRRT